MNIQEIKNTAGKYNREINPILLDETTSNKYKPTL